MDTIVEAKAGSSHLVTATEFMTGVPIQNAVVEGVLTEDTRVRSLLLRKLRLNTIIKRIVFSSDRTNRIVSMCVIALHYPGN